MSETSTEPETSGIRVSSIPCGAQHESYLIGGILFLYTWRQEPESKSRLGRGLGGAKSTAEGQGECWLYLPGKQDLESVEQELHYLRVKQFWSFSRDLSSERPQAVHSAFVHSATSLSLDSAALIQWVSYPKPWQPRLKQPVFRLQTLKGTLYQNRWAIRRIQWSQDVQSLPCLSCAVMLHVN